MPRGDDIPPSARPFSRDPYRAFLEHPAQQDSMNLLLSEVQTWVGEKGLSFDIDTSATTEIEGKRAAITWHRGAHSDNFRLDMEEDSDLGLWRTTVVIHRPEAGTGWAHIDVANSQGRFVDVPRLAGRFMDTIEMSNGPTRLTSAPVHTAIHGVEELLEAACAPDRVVPIFISATDHKLPFDAYLHQYERWTRQIRGLGYVALLDPLATAEFNDAIGRAHRVEPWTIRTFLPDVDPAVDEDAILHRTLGTRRLAGSDGAVRYLLGDVARRFAARQPISPRVFAEVRALDRVADRLAIEALTAPRARTADPSITRPLAEVAGPVIAPTPPLVVGTGPTAIEEPPAQDVTQLVKAILGLATITPQALQEIADQLNRTALDTTALAALPLDDLRDRLDRAEQEREMAVKLLSDEQLERAIAEEERQVLVDETHFLRKKLIRLAPESAWVPVPDEEQTHYPEDFRDYLALLEARPDLRVHFSGNADDAIELDALDDLGQFCRNAWEFSLVLADYVRAKDDGFGGGVDEYMKKCPDGFRVVSPKKHASRESKATMQEFGAQRVFHVPTAVAPTGFISMEAHFRLGRAGISSPRMYYFDAYHRDGCVYIGYIGTHLENTQTN